MSAPTPAKGIWCWLNFQNLGACLLVATFAVSLLQVMRVEKKLSDTSKKILRLSHWQLEIGYREGMQAAIDEYQKMHPDVLIIQQPVTEKVYGQWLNVNLVSGTAPDIVEMGRAKIADDLQYKARFFMLLTEYCDKPNPYNTGTSLEGMKWRDTLLDGMRSGFVPDLQDYICAPTSFVTVRMFYNKEMVNKATGSSEPPRTLGQMLEMCRKVRELGTREGKQLQPMASSATNADMILGAYTVPFTTELEQDADLDLDGTITERESYAAMRQGKFNMNTPRIRAMYECQKRIAQEFPSGFMSMGREQAAFLFVQGQAAMIATGAWDAGSLFKQAKFEIGIFDMPLPGPGEKWSQYITGRRNEAGAAGCGCFGVYKLSRHTDVAVDFLHFLTSPRINELFNEKAQWIPITLTAKSSERMTPFAPDPRGYNSNVSFQYGNYAQTIYRGQYWRFLQGETSYDAFVNDVTKALENPAYGGDRKWAIDYADRRRNCRNQERLQAVQLVRSLMDPNAKDAAGKFQTSVVQQVRANNGKDFAHQFEEVRHQSIRQE